MRHWRYAPSTLARRAFECAVAAGIGLWTACSLANSPLEQPIRKSLSHAVLGQSATFENPFADAPLNANTRHTRERVDQENPYSRRMHAKRFEPFEIPDKSAGVPESSFDVFELPRVVAKLRTARLDPENPFQRARVTPPAPLRLENPFAKSERFDYEQPLPTPEREAPTIKLEGWSKAPSR